MYGEDMNKRTIKVSDYIVEFLIKCGITDVFGYPGGMVTHLMESLSKKEGQIRTHITGNEQGAAFAACGYAQASDYSLIEGKDAKRFGVAFATSGPGATNLITGIDNAYYDSIPVLFITGQVNTFESKGNSLIRQKGFQETDIVSMVKTITKMSCYVDNPSNIRDVLVQAVEKAVSGRKGPVLLDIPMNVFRSSIEIDVDDESGLGGVTNQSGDLKEEYKILDGTLTTSNKEVLIEVLKEKLKTSKRPCILLGNGVKIANQVDKIREILCKCPMPVVSSMLAVDIVAGSQGLEDIYFGFIGAYGNRTANFTVAKADLFISLGARLDVRQVGACREQFAPNAQIVRVDIDSEELRNHIREDELAFNISLKEAIEALNEAIVTDCRYDEWLRVCQEIKKKVKYMDVKNPNSIVNMISKKTPDEYSVVADVGQNMVWTAQSFKFNPNQRLYLSGGMGSMGYALPSACGIYYASHRPVICINGDGGIQMNIQELEIIVRERIPVKIFVLNNSSLGMIRHFQEMYFESNYAYTINEHGYSAPDFEAIAKAYGMISHRITDLSDIEKIEFLEGVPELFNVCLEQNTIVSPKLEFGKPNQDQEPLLDRGLYNYLMSL